MLFWGSRRIRARKPLRPDVDKLPTVEDLEEALDEFDAAITRVQQGLGAEIDDKVIEYMIYPAFRDGVVAVMHGLSLDESKVFLKGRVTEAIEQAQKYWDPKTMDWLGPEIDRLDPRQRAMADLLYEIADKGPDDRTANFLGAMSMYARSSGADVATWGGLARSGIAYDADNTLCAKLLTIASVENLISKIFNNKQ